MPSMMRAVVKPSLNHAMRTTRLPERKAPTTGTKLARKTTIVSGSTSGSPRMRAPRPMPMASAAATIACVLT